MLSIILFSFIINSALAASATSAVGSNSNPIAVHEFYTKCNSTSGVCEYQLTIPVDHARRILNNTDRLKLESRINSLEILTQSLAEKTANDRAAIALLEKQVTDLNFLLRVTVERASEVAVQLRESLAEVNRSVQAKLGCDPCKSRPDPCAARPCLNGGSCQRDEFSFRCLCPDSHGGQRCEIDLDVCRRLKHLNVCNNGQCVNGTSAPVCRCNTGFEGPRCDKRIDRCLTLECKNNGKCVNGTAVPVCVCPRGFQGALCEKRVDWCKPNPCRNKGVCKQNLTQAICTCTAEFEGKFCERRKPIPKEKQLSGCGGRRFLYKKGYFYSHPQYEKERKSYYPSQLNCTWTITAKDDERVELKLEHFHLKSQYPYDYVAVYSGSEINRARQLDFYTTKTKKPKTECYRSSVITVNFVTFAHGSNYKGSGRGFRGKFDECD